MLLKSFHPSLIVVSVGIATLLAGCATPASRTIHENDLAAADASARIQAVNDTIGSNARPMTVVHKEQWVDTTRVEREAAPTPEPPDCLIDYAPKNGVATVSEFVQILAAGGCHTLVRFDTQALRHLGGGQESGGGVAMASLPAVNTAPYGAGTTLPAVAGVPSVNYGGASGGTERTIDLVYKGKMGELLDRVATQLGLFYRRDANKVDFYYTETVAYRINLKANKTVQRSTVRSGMSANVGSASGAGGISSQGSTSSGGGNDSGTTQNTDVEATQDIAGGISTAVDKMLTPGVGRYSYTADTGQLIVTDTPDIQKNIAAYVKQTNHIVTQQVVMQVTVATFQKNHSNHLAFSWDLVFESLRGKGVNMANTFPITDTSGTSAGVTILDTATGNLGRFTGSSVIVDALNEQGTAKVVQSPTIYTLNMQPTPIQSGTQVTYLAQQSNTLTAGGQASGFSQQSLIPGMFTTGFNVVTTPFVYDDGVTMTLDFSMNLSQLDKLADIVSKDEKIQGPQISNNIVVQHVKIHSGETMVISGLKSQNNKANEQGVGNPHWWLFGGGYNHDDTDTVNIIMVTPVIL